MKRLVLLCSVFTLLLCASSCMTSEREKRFQTDIFNLQTRLLQVEQKMNDEKKSTEVEGDSAKQKLASLGVEMEKATQDLSKIHGEIDALKIGVTTGQMPGVAEESKEGSVAANLKDLKERLDDLEASQAELVAAVKKSGLKVQGQGNQNKSGSGDAKELTLKDLKTLFAKKQYKEISEEAEKLVKKTKGKDKMEVMYLLSDSLYKIGRLREAALKYNELVEAFPDGKYVAYSKLRIGDCFRHLNDQVTAKIYYNELITKFQDTEEAKKAKERLAEMEKK